MKRTKWVSAAAIAAVLGLLASACSSDGSNGGAELTTASAESVTTVAATATAASPVTDTTAAEAITETVSVVVSFTADNGTGAVTVSGRGSPVAVWFGNQPGEVSLDLFDADAEDAVSVVEGLVSFWFFQDGESGDALPSILVSAEGVITDSVGTRYVVESQGLPAAPGTEQVEPVPSVALATSTPAEPATSASSSGSASSGTSEPPTSSTTSTTATSSTTTTTTSTTTTVPSADDMRVQVLNGSGIAGAAGRLTERLEGEGWDMLPAGNAPQRYGASAVYYSHDVLQDQAAEIAVDTGVSGVVVLAMPSPAPFAVEGADVYVVVLIGADDLGGSLRPPARSSSLRPRPRNDVSLPLPDSTPRDRFVPGLADIQIFSEVNDRSDNTEVLGNLDAISSTLNLIGRYHRPNASLLTEEHTYAYLQSLYQNLERALAWFGFTPQNVCGAPTGYSFTDLLKPTREWDEETQKYSGDAIFTTDRLLELHGGERINPQTNMDFCIGQAVQTAYDSLRLAELSDEIEAPQMILCDAWKLPSGEIPEAANAYWYAILTPGIQPRESLLSQGTYHLKEISRNGNQVHIIVCHPTIRERHIILYWREAGYRAEILGYSAHTGCQGTFDGETSIAEDSNGAEDTIKFSFGERVFSAADLLGFPRS